jgi:putative outer membrane efflux protein
MKRNILMTLSLLLGLTANAQETLTLQQVKERALAHNINIRTADNAILQAREQKKEAQTLYFPQVSAVGMGFKSTTELIMGDIKVADLLPSSLAAAIPSSIASMLPSNISYGMIDKGVIAGVTAIQPIFAGGQIVNGNKLAKVGVEVSELQKRVSANTVELTAEQYYWQIISLKEKQKTLETVGEMLKNLEKDAAAAVKAGVGMRNDLLEVQLKQNEIESNKLKLENGLKLARMALAQYIGTEGGIDVSTTIDASALPAYPMIKVDHSTAVAATSEYQLLQKNVDATSLQRKMEEGKRLPTVGVGVGYNYMNMGSGIKNNFGAVFATVTIPISQWWSGLYAIKRKKLAEENARQQLTDNAQLLEIRMHKNWNDVDNAYKQLVLAKKSIEQSEENLRLNRNFYHAGTVTMNNLLDAQQKYQQCRDQYTDAYAALQTKILEYEQSIGK